MTKLTLVVMDPYEAFEMYSNIEGVKEEHKNNPTFQQALNGDINAMSVFLDNDAEDIRSLTEEEISLLDLDHGGLYYIDLWDMGYIKTEEI